MRKILFALIAILLLIFTILTLRNGMNLGDVWGFVQIDAKNASIDDKNSQLGTLVSTDFPQAETKLKTSSEKMDKAKNEYEEKMIMVSDSKYYNQTEEYKMEFLWTKIGNYAKDNNVILKLDVSNGSTGELYNLQFMADGRYSDVAGFIYDIENDSRLGFKIDNFVMTALVEKINTVRGEFMCKDIRIDVKSLDDYTTYANSSSNSSTNNRQNNTASPTPMPTTTPAQETATTPVPTQGTNATSTQGTEIQPAQGTTSQQPTVENTTTGNGAGL